MLLIGDGWRTFEAWHLMVVGSRQFLTAGPTQKNIQNLLAEHHHWELVRKRCCRKHMLDAQDIVDGWNSANQLRLVVYPIIYEVLHIPGGEPRISEPLTVGSGFSMFHSMESYESSSHLGIFCVENTSPNPRGKEITPKMWLLIGQFPPKNAQNIQVYYPSNSALNRKGGKFSDIRGANKGSPGMMYFPKWGAKEP